ncbi:AI-2E family transporter [Microbacterium sp. EYE_5]|uniref:AI-2E family transporter n=1 Tax=unclassified Microbacterium TaxID=2609290 RepID=UPI002003AD57|nr:MULTISPECIES: AI-2E family transporter [unclassified Microbacterium]MCK6081698.1 AI-2E family transporter [Microbacterium sp. EYE_382]MCK6086968.1 AI-2E family transporter [Microbacterium sp. EYE_384]MCK6123534.1 AI-2E family transporter [Microbacterium sp. EYE_80]MCK6126443.1 AI-2E family transporter [Microbacterium sp. EYE_79]MCK6142652.1 AI-2E family transporter [Microbacterium sp. EYE_39]
MGLFSSSSRTVRSDESRPLLVASAGKPASMWSDGFGTLATRSLQVIIVVGIAAALILGMLQLTVVVIPVLLALILASAAAPAMAWMRRHGISSLWATLITLLGVVVVLGGIGWLVVWAVRNQWDELSQSAQQGFDSVLTWVQTLPFEIDQDQIDEWIGTLTDFVTSAQFGSGALAGVSAVANFLTGLVLMVVTLFFFLKDGPKLWEFLVRPFRGSDYDRAVRVGHKAVQTFGAYLRGTAAVAAVDAIGITIGLLILQIPLALPLGALVFVLAFIPIVGATVAGILAALVALVTNDLGAAIWVVVIVVAVNQLEGNFLQPFLMGRSMKLHAFAVLIALTIGTVLGGIVGAILAVPLTAAAWGIIQVWDGPNTPARWARRKQALDEQVDTVTAGQPRRAD